MRLAMIGRGAIARYVSGEAIKRGHSIAATLVRPEKAGDGLIATLDDLPQGTDLLVDCAGHGALRQFGPAALRSGLDVLTVSIGALADQSFAEQLKQARAESGAQLILASGAIGALDSLRAARSDQIETVRYIGRKPPKGWLGSPAETRIDLTKMGSQAQSHFIGSARDAALEYPKNANVAAAVALAGVGFDETKVELIADPSVSENIHEIQCTGAFGAFSFSISGKSLPDNPRSSALAAMSVISAIDNLDAAFRFA